MEQGKTIAAISTGAAAGGIGIVRISGREARAVADRVFRARSGKPVAGMKGYTAALGSVVDSRGEKLDDAVALVFAAPKSYTGEDVVELSVHGGLTVTRRVLRAVLEAGAYPAGPGEFTRRAFLNGKMDLTQAEAVMALISAGGEQAARAAAATVTVGAPTATGTAATAAARATGTAPMSRPTPRTCSTTSWCASSTTCAPRGCPWASPRRRTHFGRST